MTVEREQGKKIDLERVRGGGAARAAVSCARCARVHVCTRPRERGLYSASRSARVALARQVAVFSGARRKDTRPGGAVTA